MNNNYKVNNEEKIIEVKNLKKTFNENIVLEDINLYVSRGEVVSLIGPSGSGKSTILRCIVDLETITDGEVLIEGYNLQDKNFNKNLKKRNAFKKQEWFFRLSIYFHT